MQKYPFRSSRGVPARPSTLRITLCVKIWAFVLSSCSKASALRETYAYNRTLLNPDPQCPEFVQARHFDGEGGAGLGHAFMTFHHLVHVASTHNVTVKGRYKTSGHSMNSSLVDAFFFGNFFDVPLPRLGEDGPLATRSNSTNRAPAAAALPSVSLGGAWKIDDVECQSVEDFTRILSANRARGCINNSATIYTINVPMRQWGGNMDVRLFRDAYAANKQTRDAVLAGLDEPSANAEQAGAKCSEGCISVAAHIRRGDVVRRAHRRRWVPNSAYLQVIAAIHSSLSKRQPVDQRPASPDKHGPCKLCIELYAEGAASPSHVPDLDPDNEQGHTNFQDRLAQYGSVKVIRSDALSAFDRACGADVLITGRSTYSYLMSLLCKSPVILTFPWLAYGKTPNAMMLSTVVRNRTLITKTTVNMTRFLELAEQQGLSCG